MIELMWIYFIYLYNVFRLLLSFFFNLGKCDFYLFILFLRLLISFLFYYRTVEMSLAMAAWDSWSAACHPPVPFHPPLGSLTPRPQISSHHISPLHTTSHPNKQWTFIILTSMRTLIHIWVTFTSNPSSIIISFIPRNEMCCATKRNPSIICTPDLLHPTRNTVGSADQIFLCQGDIH